MILAVDTETTGTDFIHGCRPHTVTMCNGSSNFIWTARVDFERKVYWEKSDLEDIQEMLDEASTLIFHNTNFDMEALASIDIEIHHLWDKVEDTLLAYHAIDSDAPHGLKDACLRFLRFSDEDEAAAKSAVMRVRDELKYKDTDKHPTHPASKSHWKTDLWLVKDENSVYACNDAERTFLLWELFKRQLQTWNLFKPYKLRKKLLPICYKMKQNGINIYLDDIERRIQDLKKITKECNEKISKLLKLSWTLDLNTEKDKRVLFFVHLKLPITKTESGKDAINKDVIDEYLEDYPDLEELKVYRVWKEAQTEITYLQSYLNWEHNGRLHPNTNITGTRETRQSSSDPNCQNIAKPFRVYMGPPKGKVWLDIDCVNIELRLWAYAVNNRNLIERFERGESIHVMICRVLHPELSTLTDSELKETDEYGYTKNGNFALIYGSGEENANFTYKVKNAVQKIGLVFPEIVSFTRGIVKEAESNEEIYYKPCVFTLGGYKLNVPREETYKACNYYIQGSAGMIMSAMMIAVDNEFCQKYDIKMVNQVHDSLYLEMDEELLYLKPEICKVMEKAGRQFIPTCDVSVKVLHHIAF